MFNIFEQPWLLIAMAVVAFIVQRVLHAMKPEKWSNRYLLVSLGILGAAFLLDFAVSTDNEKIEHLIKTVKKAIINEDSATVGLILSKDYSDNFHRNKESAISHLGQLFEVAPVENAVIIEKLVEIEGPKAAVKLKVTILFGSDAPIPMASVVFSLDLTKNQAKQWLIRSSKLYELNKQPVEWRNLP